MKKKSVKVADRGTDIAVKCQKCGEPITHSNEFGMFCDNNCYLKESKEAYEKIKKMFGGLLK